jgi:hypothetical protein
MTPEEFVPVKGQIPDVSFKHDKSPSLRIMSPRALRSDTNSVTPDAANTDSKRIKVISDKWWLLAFLIHTAAYLGASAWINYAAIANDKMAITDGTLGPIDT